MKQFLLLLRSIPGTLTENQLTALGMKWQTLIQQWTATGNFVLLIRFNNEGYFISNTTHQKVTIGFFMENNLAVMGCVIVLANDITEAVELSKSCPTLSIGGNVEVREIQQTNNSNNEINTAK